MNTHSSNYKSIATTEHIRIPTVYDCLENEENLGFKIKFLRKLINPKHNIKKAEKPLLLFSNIIDSKFHKLLNIKNKEQVDDENIIIKLEIERNSPKSLSPNYDKEKIIINEYYLNNVNTHEICYPNILEKSRMKRKFKNFGFYSNFKILNSSGKTTKNWNLTGNKFM